MLCISWPADCGRRWAMWAPRISPSFIRRPSSCASRVRACAKATCTMSPSPAKARTIQAGNKTAVSKGPTDPFADVRKATDAHRARHRCHAYPYRRGPLLGALAAAVQAQRIVELGTALGYTSLCFAQGAAAATIET